VLRLENRSGWLSKVKCQRLGLTPEHQLGKLLLIKRRESP